MNKNVKLIAIAKDEGPYLPEWIHYHLSINIDSIHIYVNNTSDNSEEILTLINKKNKNVTFENIDYVKDVDYLPERNFSNLGFTKRNKIQAIAYSKAIEEFSDHCDYLLFLDVDEFFYAQSWDIKTCIPDDFYSSMQIPWRYESGQSEIFSPPFKEINCYQNQKNKVKDVKSLVSTSSKETMVIQNSHHIVNDKEPLILNDSDNIFIFHRWLRSQDEYLATLFRGDTFKNNILGIKTNRSGWTRDYDSKFHISNSKINNHMNSYYYFCQDNCIENLINVAREQKITCSEQLKHIIETHKKNHNSLMKVLSGTNLGIKKELNNVDIDYIKDLAIKLEKISVEDSIELMRIAKKMRPNGQIIVKKLNQYLSKKKIK